MENENCVNCKFYIRHYAISLHNRFIRTDWGHCVQNSRKYKVTRTKDICERFELLQQPELDFRQGMRSDLQYMRKRLREILYLLENNKQ